MPKSFDRIEISDMARNMARASVYSIGELRRALTALYDAGANLGKLAQLDAEHIIHAAALTTIPREALL